MPIVECEGADVWWDSSGNGAPVLLLNGLSSPSDVWFRLARQLASQFQVITIDNRGVGRTGVPPGPYTIEVMAGDAIAVLDAAGLDSAHVLGISMGGLIAQEVALSVPERTRSLTLVATHAGFNHAVSVSPEVAEQLTKAAELPSSERIDQLASLFYASTTPRHEIDIDNSIREASPTTEEGYRNQLLGAMGWDRLDDLVAIQVPTLVLHGAEDRIVPPQNSRLLADAIEDSCLRVLPNAGHQIFTDQEHLAADVVVAFLSRVESLGTVRAGVQ